MRAVKNAAVYRILHLAGLDHRVNRQQFDLHALAGHLVHTLNIVIGIFKEDAAAPGCLNLEHRRRRGGDIGKRDSGSGAGGRNTRAL